MRFIKCGIAAILLVIASSTVYGDVVLTFDHSPIADFLDIDQDYGDRVTSSVDANGHMYDIIVGNGLGPTPNVEASYGPGDPALWTSGFGDLTNIYFNDDDFDTSLQITLVADPGFEVGLFGFDVASFIAAGQTVQGIEVRDGDGNSLWSIGSQLISGPGGHNDYDFNDGLFASSLTLDVDLTGLGGLSDDIGLDNVHFGQRVVAVPEPSSSCALLTMFALCSTRMRRRRTT